jgi:BirA family biotin operon repressor/biotin-[acetyl-CoA-carboxylase] ligase
VDERSWGQRLTDGSQPNSVDAQDWPEPIYVATTGSTNADVLALARQGACEGTMVVADEQTAGRGRLNRSWDSAAAAGLWCSVLARPEQRLGLIPLVTAIAAARALQSRGVECMVKWPNDLVVDRKAHDGSPGPRKIGGILSEVDGDAVVIGIGINLTHAVADLPVPRATSVLLEGAPPDRELLVAALREELRWGFAALAAGRDVVAAYRVECLTVGREVIVDLPDGTVVSGTAARVLDDGRLEIDSSGDLHVIAAGDVIHATI